ncbi:MAG: polysaccharide deacetylase family protein [Solirubrobacterales bacterium]
MERGQRAARGARLSLLLSFDLEDYQQLVHRHLGLEGWDARSAAFERQMEAIFALLDELGVRATFFCLGMTVRHYPEIVRRIAARGDELACHGYAHRMVYEQTPEEFRADVERSLALFDELVDARPAGYRAPAFSINRDTVWALETIAELGFAYDSSQYDSRKVPRRVAPVPDAPYELELPSGRRLVEFPVAVWRLGRLALPMGGGSYWRLLPASALRRGLESIRKRTDYPPLYFHPYEFDPQPLRANLPGSASTRQRGVAAYHGLRNGPGRKSLVSRIRKIAQDHRFATHEQALAEIRADGRTRTRALSERGELV